MANRLKLDFTLNSNIERKDFVEQYLKSEIFYKKPPTNDELETIANYILWGKDPKTGLNPKQDGTIELESRYKTWDADKPESLEALFELPGFHESNIRSLNSTPLKQKKETFSRDDARKNAPSEILKALEELWKEIDTLELIINYYDLKIGKRKEQPRKTLLSKFSEEEQFTLKEKGESLGQYKYLKMRHLLVELRREQYTLRDSYSPQILSQPIDIQDQPSARFDDNIPVLPLGLKTKSLLSEKIFPTNRFPIPDDFAPSELEKVSRLLWEHNSIQKSNLYFDFTDPDHLYNTTLLFEEIEDSSQKAEIDSTLNFFLDTLNYYASISNLSELQKEILYLKLHKYKNQTITEIINPKYGKTYNANYISTIFKQKILVLISEAARKHKEIIDNIFFPENFKSCKDCGEIFLLSPTNFMRKAKSKDGFSARCKKCDKAQRLRREKEKQCKQ